MLADLCHSLHFVLALPTQAGGIKKERKRKEKREKKRKGGRSASAI
jgi:hypothetical protein